MMGMLKLNRMNRRETIKSIGLGTMSAFIPLPHIFAYPSGLENSDGYFSSQKDNVLRFLNTTQYTDEGWGRWKYNILMDRKFGLESSAMGIQILDMLDALEKVPDIKRKEAQQFFQSTWNTEELYYIDPLVSKKDKISDHHSWEHIWAHMSGAAESALRILDTAPNSKGGKAPFVDLNQVDIGDWILSLDWENPWLYGEHFSKVVKYYWHNLPAAEKSTQEPVIQKAFATLESHVMDPQTGLPIKQGCESMERGMAGLFKLISAYQTVGKEIPYAENALDSVLKLQKPNGQFGEGENLPMTINWDSMKVLKDLNEQLSGSYRFKDIRETGNRMADFLLKTHRKKDGGFSFYPHECQSVHNSVQVSEKGNVGDMQGTKFCLYCLSYADEWNA